jgi:hypothetical protein
MLMYGNFGYVLTELEEKSGLRAVLCGHEVNDDEDDHHINEGKEQNAEHLTGLISTIENEWSASENMEVRDRAIFDYLKNNIQLFIDRYCCTVDLPSELARLAEKNDCLQILIRNTLSQLTKSNIDSFLNHEIISLEKTIHENKKDLIVYDQVNSVQKFIHENSNNPLTLDKKTMKAVLSCVRLHINLWQIKTLSLEKHLAVQIKNYMAIKREKTNPSEDYVLDEDQFYSSQRHPNMQPLQSFICNKSDYMMNSIYDISLQLPSDEYFLALKSVHK